MSLSDLGFGPALAAAFAPYADSGLELGRVTVEHRGALVLHSDTEEIWADVPGRLRHRAATGADLPAVGDWVAFARHPQGGRATIEAVLPRRTAFVRKAAGFESVEQVVAANVDIVFVVDVARRRPQPAPARALSRARLGERRRAGRRPDQVRPVREHRGGRRPARRRHLRRACARRLGRHRRGHRRAHRARLRRAHGDPGRLVGRRQVDPRQPAVRLRAAGDRAAFGPTGAAATRPRTASWSCSQPAAASSTRPACAS